MVDPLGWLRASGAHSDVIEGLSRSGGDFRTLWDECPRGDWLLGIAARLGVDHALLVRAAIGCAEVASDLANEDPVLGEAFIRVLDLAGRWTRGEAGAAEVAEATSALEQAAARAPDPSTDAALRAALAVGMGVSDRDVLASAPAAAAEAQMMAGSAIDCGLAMAMRWAHDKCATAVRDAIAWSDVEPCLPAEG